MGIQFFEPPPPVVNTGQTALLQQKNNGKSWDVYDFFRAVLNSDQPLSNGVVTTAQLTVDEDSASAWDNINYEYLIPADGVYNLNFLIKTQMQITTPGFFNITGYLQINSSDIPVGQVIYSDSSNGFHPTLMSGSIIRRLSSGDNVSIAARYTISGGGVVSNPVISTGSELVITKNQVV